MLNANSCTSNNLEKKDEIPGVDIPAGFNDSAYIFQNFCLYFVRL